MKSPLLRIDQRVIGERKQREFARGFFGPLVNIGMFFAGQLTVGRFDLGHRGCLLYAQDLIVVGHR